MSAVKCGRCSCYHESVADVRRCYNGEKAAVVEIALVSPSTRATDKQIAFARKLQAQIPGRKVLDDEAAASYTKHSVSELINDLLIDVKALPKNARSYAHSNSQIQAADWPAITSGHYAVRSLTGNNDLDFFKVDVPEDGTWKGCIFVKRILGGHDAEKVQRKTAEAWLEAVIDPKRAYLAKIKFGLEMGRCGECGRSLTDEASRANGIGPDCARKQ